MMKTYIRHSLRAVCWLLLLCAGVAHAQPSASWRVWLYDAASGEMIGVDAQNGTAAETARVRLPTTTTLTQPAPAVAVSPDGGIAVYVLTNSAGDALLRAYDLTRRAIQWETTLGGVRGVSLVAGPPQRIFGPTAGAFALGFLEANGNWTLQTFNYLDPAQGRTLTAVAASSFGLPPSDRAPLPMVYDAQGVLFWIGGAAYQWDPQSGNVSTSVRVASAQFDVFPPTGEILSWTQGDAVTPPRVEIYQPVLETRAVLYAPTDETIFAARFVRDGTAVAVWQQNINTGLLALQVIGRDGGVADGRRYPLSTLDINERYPTGMYAQGTATGVVFLQEGTTLSAILIDFNIFAIEMNGAPEGALRAVWADETQTQLQLAWVGDVELGTQALYPPWVALGVGVSDSQLIAPSGLPTPTVLAGGAAGPQVGAQVEANVTSGSLQVGGTAIINTTEGDRLNVRDEPATGRVIAQLPDGTRVTLLEAPRTIDGTRWWRIQAGNVAGWVIESLNDNGVRIQTLLPG
jgi:hypothetical protein